MSPRFIRGDSKMKEVEDDENSHDIIILLPINARRVKGDLVRTKAYKRFARDRGQAGCQEINDHAIVPC